MVESIHLPTGFDLAICQTLILPNIPAIRYIKLFIQDLGINNIRLLNFSLFLMILFLKLAILSIFNSALYNIT